MTNDGQSGHSKAPAPLLLIVDGHAYAYRSFHAIRHLNSPSGKPTNAIFGFIKSLMKLRALLQPALLAVIWDGGLASERLALLPAYKAQRPPMPTELEAQLDPIVAYLHAAGLASFCQAGVEADDWIANLARQASGDGCAVVIASSDKDFMQLVSPQIGIFNPNDKTDSVWHGEAVVARTGVEPSQIVDWLSLIGDTVDNISGVPGVGPKTATELLRQFKSLEGIYEGLAQIKSERIREKLAAAQSTVFRNRNLIQLKSDAPQPIRTADLAVNPIDSKRLDALFSEWGFSGLRRELAVGELKQGEFLA